MYLYRFTSLITMTLEIAIRFTIHSLSREQELRVPYEHIKVVVEPPEKCELIRFAVKTRSLLE